MNGPTPDRANSEPRINTGKQADLAALLQQVIAEAKTFQMPKGADRSK